MTLEYNKIDEIDWKEVKKQWDANFVFFRLVFFHENRKVIFDSCATDKRRIKLMIYIDGIWEGSWLNKEHPFYKYHNQKLVRPTKYMKELEALRKKQLKKSYKAPEPYYFATPYFDNVSQIKKMVEGLKNEKISKMESPSNA